jgi:hypothetical protein
MWQLNQYRFQASADLPNILDLMLKQSDRQPGTSAKDYGMYLCYCMATTALKHMNDEIVELTKR